MPAWELWQRPDSEALGGFAWAGSLPVHGCGHGVHADVVPAAASALTLGTTHNAALVFP